MAQSSALPPELAPLAEDDPRVIGPFRVVGRLGAGGMGAVYGALDAQGRCVAVKVIHARYAHQGEYRQQFAREVALLRELEVECAPAFLGADPEAALPWLATEFVAGRTLRAHVREFGPLAGGALLAFAAGTAEAVGALHAAGVLHRDIKPGNVILSPSGPRVLDFGIARGIAENTPEEGVYGTPGYLAPERMAGQSSSPASDVFAWGGLVAFAATGRAPFGEGETTEVLRRVREGAYDVGGVPGSLRGLVERALAADPARRPSAAECFAGALALSEPGATPGTSEEERRYRLRRALVAVWQGFDAAGHDPRAWVAFGGAAAAGAGTGAALLGGGAGAGVSTVGGAGISGASATATATGTAAGSLATAAATGTAALSLTTKLAIGAGAAAVATTLTVGGAAVMSGGEDSTAAPTAEADSEESVSEEETADSPPFDAQEVEYRGMTLLVPEAWEVYRYEEEFNSINQQEIMVDEWVLLVPDTSENCTQPPSEPTGLWAPPPFTDEFCPYIKVLGPGGVSIGAPGGMPYEAGDSYAPTTDPTPCAANLEISPLENIEGMVDPLAELGVRDSGQVAVGDREAEYVEAPNLCMELDTSQMSYYYQHIWYLAEEEILIVDHWLHEDFPDMLEYAEW